jgi:RNHCP domain
MSILSKAIAANGGLMEPVAVWVRSDSEWSLFHRCARWHACTVIEWSVKTAGNALLPVAYRRPPPVLGRPR